jgi:GTP cyclohydrolase-4
VITVVDTQDEEPHHKIELSEVGVANFKTLLRIKRNGEEYTYIPECKITINLPPERKGAHLSRLVESVTEILSLSTNTHHSVEEMTISTLKEIHSRHPFITAQMRLNFDFVMKNTTPISKKRTLEVYSVEVLTASFEGIKEFYHRVSIQSKGNTVCPHAYAESGMQYTHIQRAIGRLSVAGSLEDIPYFEEMADVLEHSYSAPTFSVLKTPDEQATVHKMFTNPLFAEDVTRNILANAKDKFKGNVNIHAKVISEESIHKHDVLCKGQVIRDQKINLIFCGKSFNH